MVRVDHCLRLWLVGEGVLHDFSEAPTTLRLFTHLEVDLRGAMVILCHYLLVLAPRHVQLDTGPLFQLFHLVECLLEYLKEILVDCLVFLNRLHDLHEVNHFEVLLQKGFCSVFLTGSQHSVVHLSVDLFIVRLPQRCQDGDSFGQCHVIKLANCQVKGILVLADACQQEASLLEKVVLGKQLQDLMGYVEVALF